MRKCGLSLQPYIDFLSFGEDNAIKILWWMCIMVNKIELVAKLNLARMSGTDGKRDSYGIFIPNPDIEIIGPHHDHF